MKKKFYNNESGGLPTGSYQKPFPRNTYGQDLEGMGDYSQYDSQINSDSNKVRKQKKSK